jgi:hypothetical protein
MVSSKEPAPTPDSGIRDARITVQIFAPGAALTAEEKVRFSKV